MFSYWFKPPLPGKTDGQNQFLVIFHRSLHQAVKSDEEDVIALVLDSGETEILVKDDIAPGREESLDGWTRAAIWILSHDLLTNYNLRRKNMHVFWHRINPYWAVVVINVPEQFVSWNLLLSGNVLPRWHSVCWWGLPRNGNPSDSGQGSSRPGGPWTAGNRASQISPQKWMSWRDWGRIPPRPDPAANPRGCCLRSASFHRKQGPWN